MLTVKANRKVLLGNEHVYDSVLVELAGFRASTPIERLLRMTKYLSMKMNLK